MEDGSSGNCPNRKAEKEMPPSCKPSTMTD